MTARRVCAQVPPVSPAIAIVGEAPGEEEEDRGVPFVGPSGRLLSSLLRVAGIDREEVWIGNVFEYKAPDNNVEPWIRGPEGEEAVARLGEEMDKARPNVIVALGATALWAMTGSAQIGRDRGALTLATRAGAGRKVLPTFHPAFLFKQWKLLPVVVGDLVKAGREAETPELELPRRRFLVDPTLAEVRGFLSECYHADPLSVDIETGWGQIRSIQFAPSEEEAITVPFIDLRRPDKSYWRSLEDEVEVWRAVGDLLASPVPKVGQNFPYDLYWLMKAGFPVYNYREDTRLMHAALYPELPKSLAFMGASYGRQGSWKYIAKKEGKRDDT